MRSITTNKGIISVWEDPKELPIDRFADFQKYAIQDVGIGSTMEDINRHYSLLDSFLSAGKIDEARMERQNLHFNLYLAISEIQITDITFACFVQSVNSTTIIDYSESGLQNTCKLLAEIELNRGQLEEVLSEIKKKLIPR